MKRISDFGLWIADFVLRGAIDLVRTWFEKLFDSSPCSLRLCGEAF